MPDYIDRDLHRRNRSSVLKPVCGVPILGPAHSRPIVRSASISMVSDRSLRGLLGSLGTVTGFCELSPVINRWLSLFIFLFIIDYLRFTIDYCLRLRGMASIQHRAFRIEN